MPQYTNPPIVASFSQILLSWNYQEMLAALKALRSEAESRYKSIHERTTQNLNIKFENQEVIREQTSRYGGIECRLENGGICLIEETGIRYWMRGPYEGRDNLTTEPLWWYEKIIGIYPDIKAIRASILIENIILPDLQDGIFRIEDYIVPQFELSDPELENYIEYHHRIALDLRKRTSNPMHAILTIESGHNDDKEKRPVIKINIDTLHRDPSLFPNLQDCFSLVKDEESHIFESVITDKTRSAYGLIKS